MVKVSTYHAVINLSCYRLTAKLSASHLSDSECFALIKSAREALDKNNFEQVPILAGTGTGSAHSTIKLCVDAQKAGADHVIVISPGYYSAALKSDRAALKEFFVTVMDNSRE